MPTKHEWRRSTWDRLTPEGRRSLVFLYGALQEQIESLPDDAPMPGTVGEFRAMLANGAPRFEPGASLVDRERGVTYRVTLDPARGSVGLRTVEIDTKGATDPGVFRVPVAEVVREAAAVLSYARSKGDGQRPAIIIGSRGGGRPSVEELAALVRAGVSRAEIARRADRTVSRVDQWLREARDERPDLDWNRPSKPTKGTP